MSEKPVAWMNEHGAVVVRSDVPDGGILNPDRAVPDSWTPLQSPAEVRALAIAECARVVESADSGYLPELAAAIRALSPAPTVSEEWVRARVEETFGLQNAFRAEDAVRATLAALGVEVK